MEPEPGEHVELERRANHSAGSRAVGGKLTVTDRRIVFEPHGLDKALAGKSVQIPLAEVAAAGTQPRGLNPFSGALRERLRVETSGGDEHLFVIGGRDEVIALIDRLRAGR